MSLRYSLALLALVVSVWSPGAPADDGFECPEFREHLLGVRPPIDRREERSDLLAPEIVRVEEHVIDRDTGGCLGDDGCKGRVYAEIYIRNLDQPLVLMT
ncbi:MAG: hypothetical protein AAFU79_18170, partial [Myxococcota bacterium]